MVLNKSEIRTIRGIINLKKRKKKLSSDRISISLCVGLLDRGKKKFGKIHRFWLAFEYLLKKSRKKDSRAYGSFGKNFLKNILFKLDHFEKKNFFKIHEQKRYFFKKKKKNCKKIRKKFIENSFRDEFLKIRKKKKIIIITFIQEITISSYIFLFEYP